MADTPDQSARIKHEPGSEDPRAPPPSRFYFDSSAPTSQAAPPPGGGGGGVSGLLGYDLDRLLQESRDLVSLRESAAGPPAFASPSHMADGMEQGEVRDPGSGSNREPDGSGANTEQKLYMAPQSVAPLFNREIAIPINSSGGQARPGNELNVHPSRANVFGSSLPSGPSKDRSFSSIAGVRDPSDNNTSSAHTSSSDIASTGLALVNLNNKAQGKGYRATIDVYQKNGCEEYYGTVYIGTQSSTKLRQPERSVSAAKKRLAELGVKLIESMPRGAPDMLRHFPQRPKSPPPGFTRPPLEAGRVPSEPSGSFQAQPKSTASQYRISNYVRSVFDRFQRREVTLNFISILYEWSNLNPHVARPDFSTVNDRQQLRLKYPGGVQLFAHHRRDQNPENIPEGKHKLAEQGVAWLLDNRWLKSIDDDGHVRQHGKRPAPDPQPEEPSQKRLQIAAPAGPRALSGTSTSDIRSPRHNQPGAATSPASRSDEDLTKAFRLSPYRDKGEPSSAAVSERASEAPSRPADEDKEEYLSASRELAGILGLGEPILYWMPADPEKSPRHSFNASAHFKGHSENGVEGGAVVVLRNLWVVNGVADVKEKLGAALYEWLNKRRAQRRLELAEQLKLLEAPGSK